MHVQAESMGVHTPSALVREREREREKEGGRARVKEREREIMTERE